MLPLTALHQLAGPRGDGLRPELLARLQDEGRLGAVPQVAEIAHHRGRGPVRAGPDPLARVPDELPENVVRFDAARPKRHAHSK